MDAKVWTDEFMATKARLGNKEFDHAMMLAWFANAIMAGFDEANRRAQRALDAERERVAFLDKKNVALVEASNLVLNVKAEQDAQLATLQAQVKQLGRTLADVYQQRDGLQAQLRQVEGELAAMKGATNASS
jgi:chromosome segregation ATPase